MTSLRVLELLTYDDLAGTELMTFDLVTLLSRQQFDIQVAILMNRGPLALEYESFGIPVHVLQGDHGLITAAINLGRLLRSTRFDIVHMYGFKTSVIGRLIFRLMSPATIRIHGIQGLHVTEGEEERHLSTRFALSIERLLSLYIDYYQTNSQGAIQFLVQNAGLQKAKLFCIPSGVDVRQWNPNDHKNNHPPVIACVARFIPRKRQDDLLYALNILYQHNIDFQCDLVGYGPTLLEMQSLADRLRIQHRVRFLGKASREQVKNLLSGADMFVLPSLWEGLPGSMMEAMATGLPVVGTDVNGTNELVIDGDTGFLVPPKSPEALADRLAWLINNPEARVEMGLRGRKRIVEEFSLDSMVKRTEMFYRSAVETRQSLS
jgi:glycosyltransferase involved in cell wall biosynthesis